MATERAPTATEQRTREAAEKMGRTMRGVSDETREALSNIETLPPYETLQVLGGIIALGVGTLLFFFGLAGITVIGPIAAAVAAVLWIWNLIWGFLVLLAFAMFRRSPLTGTILGVVFGIFLLFGGLSGVVGGILAILGFAWGYWVVVGGKLPTARPPAA